MLTLKEHFVNFFFKACYMEEKDTSSEFEFMKHSGDAVYIQMLTISFFQFALNS